MIELKLLGGALLEEDGVPVSGIVGRRHPLGLLALLATAPSRTMSRGKLVGLLWPASPERKARNRLNTCLHRTRRRLGEGAVVSDGKDVRLARAALECDVWAFRDALSRDELAVAVAAYDGPFLDGFDLSGSPPFEKWLDHERLRIREGYRDALARLAEGAEERGDHEGAARWWRKRVVDDPYDSRATAKLMEALAATGNRAAALHAATMHERLLADELSAVPDGSIGDLRERLANGSDVGDPSPKGGRKAGVGGPVAVLPFENLAGSDDASRLAEGLHADLVNDLSRVGSLTVISRASVLGYRDSSGVPSDIADELGVRTVIEGQVQQVGRRIRVRIRVVDATTGAQLWGDRWDRELTAEKLFELQSELARQIVSRLEGEAIASDRSLRKGLPTTDLDAYRLYVRGRTHLEQSSLSGFEQAAGVFRSAVDRDPRYAAAWAGLAEALSRLVSYHHRSFESHLPEAERAARRAVELDPSLAEGHAALGLVLAVDRRGPESLGALRRAVELRPGDAHALSLLAMVLGPLGFWEQGIQYLVRACRLDPNSPEMHYCLAERYCLPGASAERALAHARRAQALSPGYAEGHLIEGRILADTGRFEEALAPLRRALDLASPGSRPRHLYPAARAHAAAGRPEQAQQFLAELEEHQDPFFQGAAHAVLGDLDAAFERLGRTDWSLLKAFLARYDPALEALRADARYSDLIREANLAWGLDADGSLPTGLDVAISV